LDLTGAFGVSWCFGDLVAYFVLLLFGNPQFLKYNINLFLLLIGRLLHDLKTLLSG
jgi:hypothetical protein